MGGETEFDAERDVEADKEDSELAMGGEPTLWSSSRERSERAGGALTDGGRKGRGS
jgi:hypothetical protein